MRRARLSIGSSPPQMHGSSSNDFTLLSRLDGPLVVLCFSASGVLRLLYTHARPLSALSKAGCFAEVSMGVRFLASRCCYSTGGLSRAHSRAAVTGTRRSSSAEAKINRTLAQSLLGSSFRFVFL